MRYAETIGKNSWNTEAERATAWKAVARKPVKSQDDEKELMHSVVNCRCVN
jgi:hypothetical protein